MGQPFEVPNPRTALLEAVDAVFDGDVVRWSTVTGNDEVEVAIVVRRRWKGAPTDTVVVRTSLHSTMCGFDFERSGRYLVFAFVNASGRLMTTKCSSSTAWGSGAERLVALLGPPSRLP
jgi:hypothetical protein